MGSLKGMLKERAPRLVYLWRCLRHPRLATQKQEATFTKIYRQRAWGEEAESVSGPGSDHFHTEAVRAALPGLLRDVGCGTLLDVPCGDFHWMKSVDLGHTRYVGGDIVRPLVEETQRLYGNQTRRFTYVDLTEGPLPRADVVLVRDCFIHLPNRMALKALAKIAGSGSQYLLTTTFVDRMVNDDIPVGMFRPLNLQRPPFNLPEPMRLVDERAPGYPGKRLGLWRIADIHFDP